MSQRPRNPEKSLPDHSASSPSLRIGRLPRQPQFSSSDAILNESRSTRDLVFSNSRASAIGQAEIPESVVGAPAEMYGLIKRQQKARSAQRRRERDRHTLGNILRRSEENKKRIQELDEELDKLSKELDDHNSEQQGTWNFEEYLQSITATPALDSRVVNHRNGRHWYLAYIDQ